MPDRKLEAPSDVPLFPEDDPLTITVPGARGADDDTPEAGGTFRCLDRANPPLEDVVNPETRPVSYLVALLTTQVVPDERDAFEAALIAAVEDNRVTIASLLETAQWLGEVRGEAERATIGKVTDRPTKARPRSTR
jgi:hypothetical protein